MNEHYGAIEAHGLRWRPLILPCPVAWTHRPHEVERSLALGNRAIAITSSYDEDYDTALESLRFWGGTLPTGLIRPWNLRPTRNKEHGLKIGKDAFEKAWLIATSPEDIVKSIEEYIHLGFSNIVLISSSPSQDKYIDVVGWKVLPYFRKTLE